MTVVEHTLMAQIGVGTKKKRPEIGDIWIEAHKREKLYVEVRVCACVCARYWVHVCACG